MTEDATWMRRALRLAARAQGRTAPNPMVGAVVVQAGECVGEGFHPRAGEPHAEVFALRSAGVRARGATLYVTLEPCCHHGRTPPCVAAILAAGVGRVVAAMSDPYPKVAGGGLAALQQAGVPTTCGLLEEQAVLLNRAYLKAVRVGLPWVTLKMAMTLDGRVATAAGDSRWVSGEPARRLVHRLRDQADAVLIGIGTALADDPRLTCRVRGGRDPVRVVVDPRARLPLDSELVRTAGETPTLLVVGEAAKTQALEQRGVGIERFALHNGRLHLREVLERLVGRGLHKLLCEGGPGLAGSLFDQGCVDEVVWFVAPKLLGGSQALGPVGGQGEVSMESARPLRGVRSRKVGEDWMFRGYLRLPGEWEKP